MVLVYPVLLVLACVLVLTRDRAGGRGWRWFGAWTAAGALLVFSFLTGFSIGLFVLPVAALVLVAAALWSPHVGEATGFVAGVGVVALVIAAVSWDHGGVDVAPWAAAGVVFVVTAVSGYGLARRG